MPPRCLLPGSSSLSPRASARAGKGCRQARPSSFAVAGFGPRSRGARSCRKAVDERLLRLVREWEQAHLCGRALREDLSEEPNLCDAGRRIAGGAPRPGSRARRGARRDSQVGEVRRRLARHRDVPPQLPSEEQKPFHPDACPRAYKKRLNVRLYTPSRSAGSPLPTTDSRRPRSGAAQVLRRGRSGGFPTVGQSERFAFPGGDCFTRFRRSVAIQFCQVAAREAPCVSRWRSSPRRDRARPTRLRGSRARPAARTPSYLVMMKFSRTPPSRQERPGDCRPCVHALAETRPASSSRRQASRRASSRSLWLFHAGPVRSSSVSPRRISSRTVRPFAGACAAGERGSQLAHARLVGRLLRLWRPFRLRRRLGARPRRRAAQDRNGLRVLDFELGSAACFVFVLVSVVRLLSVVVMAFSSTRPRWLRARTSRRPSRRACVRATPHARLSFVRVELHERRGPFSGERGP